MIEGKYLFYGDDLSDAFEIRKNVFQLEQKVEKNIEFDGLDNDAIHVVVYEGSKAVATGRLLYKPVKVSLSENPLQGASYHIGRIAVLKEERGKKYGDFVVRMLIDKAFLMGAREVTIGAQIHAVGFYSKIGFVSCGEEYEEAGIKHIKMVITPSNICKCCNKNC